MQQHLHILGICGTFMGGVATIARQLGFKVTGSDENIYPPMSDALEQAGIDILSGYKATHLQPKPDLVIVGNVCMRGNEAVEHVLNEGIPYFSGPQWLSQYVLRGRHVLAVSGTHGKTTTTSMLAWMLQHAGLKPGYLIGGLANNFESTAALGESSYFVIEADEYDCAFFDKKPKFMHYLPRTVIVNNIEFDHSDLYADLDAIKQQFHQLVRIVPGNGLLVYPETEQNVIDVLNKGVWSSVKSFAGPLSTLQMNLLKPDGSEFEVFDNGRTCGRVQWNCFGQHNLENACAAMLAAGHVGVPVEKAVQALNSFRGVKRRLERVGQAHEVTIYDDFAHHPSAIAKTIAALRRKVGQKKIVAVVQFASNTMRRGGHDPQCVAQALKHADQVVILNPNLVNDYIETIQRSSKVPVAVFNSVADILTFLRRELVPHDQVLVMSNKNFGGLQTKLLSALHRRRESLNEQA